MRGVLPKDRNEIRLVRTKKVRMAAEQTMDFERTMLDALAQDMDEHPETLQPVATARVEWIRHLVAGVEVIFDEPLPPDLDDEGML